MAVRFITTWTIVQTSQIDGLRRICWPLAQQSTGVQSVTLIAKATEADSLIVIEVVWVLIDSDGDSLDDDVEERPVWTPMIETAMEIPSRWR